jgi:hypothetical protein
MILVGNAHGLNNAREGAGALIVTCRSLTALTAQPTTNRENRSRIAARYSLPLPPITDSVVSPSQR